MAYVIYERTNTRVSSPTITFATNGRIILNVASARILHGNAVEFVLLLFDKEQHKVALRPLSKRDKRAYKITYPKNVNGASFSGKGFLDAVKIDYSKKRTFPAKWDENEGLLEMSLSEEFGRVENQRKLLPVESKRYSKVG
jgi:hypothetical protein